MADDPTNAPSTAPTKSSLAPHPKVIVGTLAGAATAILVWVLNTYAKANIPGEIGSAITVVISSVLAYIIPGGAE